MYDKYSMKAEEFISDEEIKASIAWAEENKNNLELVNQIIDKSADHKGLSHREAILLLLCEDKDAIQRIFARAAEIKDAFYGNRIVIFAPLYLSNYCVNGCLYCPYHHKNKHIARRKLTQEEIRKEVIALQDMGHKRLALETGEDPVNCPIEYVLESIKTIYSIKHLHPTGPKHNYAYHTEAMDRAMEGGIDDVGCGVLFGLNLYKYDFVGILMHAEHLEAVHGVGPHTISVPRLRNADDVDVSEYENAISDELFQRIVAVLRVAVPYTGIIISTRESQRTREMVLPYGVSQISGGSRTTVGGYAEDHQEENSAQFEISDHRSLDEVVHWLLENGHVPSFCTACYREGRTGDRFMSLVKAGQIRNCCHPNALMTLKEYAEDYASPETHKLALEVIEKEAETIPNEKVREKVFEHLHDMDGGMRDFRF